MRVLIHNGLGQNTALLHNSPVRHYVRLFTVTQWLRHANALFVVDKPPDSLPKRLCRSAKSRRT